MSGQLLGAVRQAHGAGDKYPQDSPAMRERDVPNEINRLEKEIDSVWAMFAELESRLTPVLHVAPPEAASNAIKAAEEQLVPYAARLRGLTQKLANLYSTMHSVTQRLEV